MGTFKGYWGPNVLEQEAVKQNSGFISSHSSQGAHGAEAGPDSPLALEMAEGRRVPASALALRAWGPAWGKGQHSLRGWCGPGVS